MRSDDDGTHEHQAQLSTLVLQTIHQFDAWVFKITRRENLVSLFAKIGQRHCLTKS